jgi:3-phosphoshikimate 1-carboxyvinyltransferase
MDALPPGQALGAPSIPGSKSVTNRALLLAAQCEGVSRLKGGLEAEDTRWMRKALQGLGIPLQEAATEWVIHGGARPRASEPLWVGASGSSLRFLLPWLALQAQEPVILAGEPRLFDRPLGPLLKAIEALGGRWESRPSGGILHPVPAPPQRLEVLVDASLSSQFVTGLALAAAGLPEGGRIRWTGEAASRSYLELSDHWLRRFGCPSRLEPGFWEVPGGQLRPQSLTLPGDWSGAAAFLCAAAVTGRAIKLAPLDSGDAQGDRQLLEILAGAGCSCAWNGAMLTLKGPLQCGFRADLTNCPDLAPVLAAAAALAPGESLLTGLHTLPLKECDRLDASAELVRWLGGSAEILDGVAMRIRPGPTPGPRPPFDPRRDHRMAFAAAVGALRAGGELRDPDCVAKTFPTFWEAWRCMLEGR